MMPASDGKRLLASLALSCLLHAALAFMPYFGISAGISRPAVQGRHEQAPEHVLNATLILENEPAATVTGLSTEGASAAGAGAHGADKEEPRPTPEHALGIGLLPIAAPSYYTTDQLTKRPRPTAEANLDPPEIGPIFASGTIVLVLWISEFGKVIAVDVEKTDLPQALTATAVAAFRNLPFIPGEINGRRVGTLMRIEVIYDDGTRPRP